jgi:hypothetical protein
MGTERSRGRQKGRRERGRRRKTVGGGNGVEVRWGRKDGEVWWGDSYFLVAGDLTHKLLLKRTQDRKTLAKAWGISVSPSAHSQVK